MQVCDTLHGEREAYGKKLDRYDSGVWSGRKETKMSGEGCASSKMGRGLGWIRKLEVVRFQIGKTRCLWCQKAVNG